MTRPTESPQGHIGNFQDTLPAQQQAHSACAGHGGAGVGTKRWELPWSAVVVTPRKGRIRKTLLSDLNEPA